MLVSAFFALTLFCWVGSIAGSVTLVPGPHCLGLEDNGGVLELQSLDSFIVSVNLDLDLPLRYIKAYDHNNDSLGANCTKTMNDRFNASVQNFRRKVLEYQDENGMLFLYLHSFIGKAKREVSTLLIALITSISNLVATSLNIVISEARWNEMNARFNAMNILIQDMENSHNSLINNVEFLRESNTFIGIEKNLIVEHLNLLQDLWACHMLKLNFDAKIDQFDSHLTDLLSTVYDKKLRHTIINRKLLEEISMDSYFENMIYRISPSLLYELARMDLLHFRNNKLTFMVTFPVIGRTFKYKLINILEAPRRLAMTLPTFHSHRSFLVPFTVEIESLANHVSQIRSAKNCIKTEQFYACPAHDIDDFTCLASMFNMEGTDCTENEMPVGEFHFQYDHRQKGALVSLKGKSRIVDTFSNMTLYHVVNENEIFCLFLPRQENVSIVSEKKTIRLFPNLKYFNVKDDFAFKARLFIEKKTLSLPTPNATGVYIPLKPIVRKETFVNYPLTFGATIPASALIIVLILVSCAYVCSKCREVDGGKLFS